MSIELTIKKPQNILLKSVKVSVKVCDRGIYDFIDDRGDVIHCIDEDYVPSFFPEDHYGDCLFLDIDLETGKILNWKAPTAEQLSSIINGEEDD